MDICKLGKFGPCNLVKCGAVEYLLFVDVPALLMLCQTIGMSVVVLALACAAVACAPAMSCCFYFMLQFILFAIYVNPICCMLWVRIHGANSSRNF